MDEATWDMVFDTNVKGPFFLMQSLRPLLAPGGAVVLCGSAAGRRASAGTAAYGASKAALEHLTRILAAVVMGEGIRVNIVIPAGRRRALPGLVRSQLRHSFCGPPGGRRSRRLHPPGGVAATAAVDHQSRHRIRERTTRMDFPFGQPTDAVIQVAYAVPDDRQRLLGLRRIPRSQPDLARLRDCARSTPF
jgi:NAD(P)-dependent dehydrogenase (short-subunit alcohol dehydrogenase family)